MSDAPPSLPSQPNRTRTLIVGMVVANLVGGGLALGLNQLIAILKGPHEHWLVKPSIFLVPFIAGVAAAWCWRKLALGPGLCALHSFTMTAISVAAAALFLGEGVVCLVMAAPVLYVAILFGVLAGRAFFKPDFTKLQLSVFPVLALLAVGETWHRVDEMAVVTDELLIHAPPEKVWPHVLAFPEIPDRADYWIFRLGLPFPTQTTNGGNFVGADRACKFSDGIVIKERVAEFVPNEKLTFDIIEQPTHPEAYGHITLHRGQFVLRDNRNGTTTLIGSSWYTLHVRPRWYFDLWTRDMTREVHLRVMKHVQRLAEADRAAQL